tara:strand:+ start:2433 stop:4229 length:1797 start_codon:yes stop_codon:yes gene_type:complete
MENKQTIVEIVKGKIHNRNKVTTLEQYRELKKSNAFKGEMYRSYYSFDKTFTDFVIKNKSVKGFDGLVYVDKIIIDIDKGDIDDENLQEYLRHSCNDLFDFGIDSNHVNVWFSGSGYHIELLNIFGFQPNKNLHEKVKATMSEYFSFGDNIYDKTRIIRSKWSLNTKTNLYKVWIPLQYIWDLTYADIKKISQSKATYNKFAKSKEHFWSTYNDDTAQIEPYLQKHVLSKPTSVMINNTPIKSGTTNSMVTCVQHIFNEGPAQGSRNMKMMRMISSYKRAGIPFLVTLNGMITWSNGELESDEITRTVTNVFENQYSYGCDDSILMEYCDPKCIYFKRKDYMLDIKDVDSLEDNFRKYVMLDHTEKSIDLSTIFNGINQYLFKPGELIIFSGDTGMGKTALVQQIIALCKKETLFLSLEMNENLTWRRFVQIVEQKPKEWVYEAYKTDNVSFKDKLSHIRIMTIAPEIEAVKKVVAQYEPNVLVIDTTDELQVDGNKGAIETQNAIIDGLKQIAQRNDTIVIAIHHVNKASAAQGTIGLHSLKGSSNVVQKADKVMVVKGNRNEMHRTITSEKSRDEARFELVTIFQYKTMTFEPIDM